MTHYLDYAATSAVRPPDVIRAVSDFLQACGATPGRGGHGPAVEAGRLALRTRRAVLEVLGLAGGDPGRFVFTLNATHALNMALQGLLERGDAVVSTVYDHNAVVRPLHRLARERGIDVRTVAGDAEGNLDEEAFAKALEGARLVCLNAASNVLGTTLPLDRLAVMAREAGALVLVDVAQTAGCLDVDLTSADLVAVTGHKGLLGPQGIGGLWARPGVEVAPLLMGGTGGDSLDPEGPPALPERLEAGTQNAPGMAGLEAGCGFLLECGIRSVHQRTAGLKSRLRDGLAEVRGLELLSPAAPQGIPIVTVRAAALDPATLAHRLDVEYGVQARAGLHCAPGAHRTLGTTETGALRFSLGWASTEADVDRAVEGTHHVLASLSSSD